MYPCQSSTLNQYIIELRKPNIKLDLQRTVMSANYRHEFELQLNEGRKNSVLGTKFRVIFFDSISIK